MKIINIIDHPSILTDEKVNSFIEFMEEEYPHVVNLVDKTIDSFTDGDFDWFVQQWISSNKKFPNFKQS